MILYGIHTYTPSLHVRSLMPVSCLGEGGGRHKLSLLCSVPFALCLLFSCVPCSLFHVMLCVPCVPMFSMSSDPDVPIDVPCSLVLCDAPSVPCQLMFRVPCVPCSLMFPVIYQVPYVPWALIVYIPYVPRTLLLFRALCFLMSQAFNVMFHVPWCSLFLMSHSPC